MKDSKIVGVRGRAVDRVNKGRLGPKGLYWYGSAVIRCIDLWLVFDSSAANHKEGRLLYPLIRKNGQLERSTWDEAMNLIVAKTKDI